MTTEIGAQVRTARRGGGVSIREAAGAVGLDASTFGRIERHELENVSLRQLALACAAVGLDLGARAHLAGEPVRDKAQLQLLDRFRVRLPIGSPWATEVPLPIRGDLRAIDAWTRLGGETIGIEAETRLADLQAVERKVNLKKRDAGLDRMILLIAETREPRRPRATQRLVAGRVPARYEGGLVGLLQWSRAIGRRDRRALMPRQPRTCCRSTNGQPGTR